MHYCEYHHKSPEILQKAKEKYPGLFDIDYSDESREVRYYLLEYLYREFGYDGVLDKDTNGKPIPIKNHGTLLYWSISHSNEYLAFIVSDNPTGIDIVQNTERGISIQDFHLDSEYDILGGKNWNNFYILWSAKESIIKVVGGGLDDMKKIQLMDTDTASISLFAFEGKSYSIQTIQIDSLIISHII